MIGIAIIRHNMQQQHRNKDIDKDKDKDKYKQDLDKTLKLLTTIDEMSSILTTIKPFLCKLNNFIDFYQCIFNIGTSVFFLHIVLNFTLEFCLLAA